MNAVIIAKAKKIDLAIKIAIVASFTMVVAGNVDSVWHQTVGRDSFWIPPHIFIYSSYLAIGLALLYLLVRFPFGTVTNIRFRLFREERSVLLDVTNVKTISLAGLGIILFSAPFDEWWHRNILPPGTLELPITLPHFVLFLGGITTGISIIFFISMRLGENAKLANYLYIMLLGGMMMFAHAAEALRPFHTNILGDLGTVIFTFTLISCFTFTRNFFRYPLFWILMPLIAFSEIAFLERELFIFTPIMISGLLIVLLNGKLHPAIVGFVAGVTLSSILWIMGAPFGVETVLRTILVGGSAALASSFGYYFARSFSILRPNKHPVTLESV